jgi:hypothetical protein
MCDICPAHLILLDLMCVLTLFSLIMDIEPLCPKKLNIFIAQKVMNIGELMRLGATISPGFPRGNFPWDIST